MSKDLKITTPDISKLHIDSFVSRYAGFCFIILITLLYCFFVIRINSLAKAEPSDQDVQQTSSTKRLKIDQDAVDKIQQLEDQNVRVQSLFEEARDNPFQD